MQNEFTTYSSKILPPGFQYPEMYLNFSKGVDFPNQMIWWFEDAETEGGKLSWELRLNYVAWKAVGDRELVPFAQLNDEAAFFDGTDLSGDPRVIVIDLGNKDRSYVLNNFEVWLIEIQKS